MWGAHRGAHRGGAHMSNIICRDGCVRKWNYTKLRCFQGMYINIVHETPLRIIYTHMLP